MKIIVNGEIKIIQFTYGRRIKDEESKGKDLSHLTEYHGFKISNNAKAH